MNKKGNTISKQYNTSYDCDNISKNRKTICAFMYYMNFKLTDVFFLEM